MPAITVRYLRGIHDEAVKLPHPERLERRTRGMARLGGLIPPALLERALAGEEQFSRRLGGVLSFLVVFVAPLCEEIVYRGLLWGAVERRWGRWVALVVTTVVFALAHLEFTRIPLLLVVAIPIALARLYSGGLLASIVAHQVTNLLPGIVLMLGLAGIMPTT